jgi:hypothetical protein
VKVCLGALSSIGGENHVTYFHKTFLQVSEPQLLIECLAQALQNVMKKFLSEVDVLLLTVDVLQLFLNLEPFEGKFLTGGLAQLLINRLDEESTSRSLGVSIIQVLVKLASRAKTNLTKLNDMKAFPLTMSFVISHKYDLDVRQRASSLIVLLSNLNHILTQSFQDMIDSLMQ